MYQKEIIYMGLYKDGNRIGNAGFLKVENRDTESRLDLKLKNIPSAIRGRFPIRFYNGTEWKEVSGIAIQEGSGSWTEQIASPIERVQVQIVFPDGYFLEGRGKGVEETVSWEKAKKNEESVATREETWGEKPGLRAVQKSRSQKSMEDMHNNSLQRITEEVQDNRPQRITEEVQDNRPQRITEEAQDKGLQRITEEAQDNRPQRITEEAQNNGLQRITEEAQDNRRSKAVEDMQDNWLQRSTEDTWNNRPQRITEEVRGRRPQRVVEETPDNRVEMQKTVIITEELKRPDRGRNPVMPVHLPETPSGYNLKEDKWEQILDSYEQIHPYGDERIYVKLEPRDFIILQSNYQHLVNNSFLLHGFYNYRYVILGKEQDFYLGVPGVFYEREKMVALMFGFEAFECPGGIARAGEFGYYLRKVEL